MSRLQRERQATLDGGVHGRTALFLAIIFHTFLAPKLLAWPRTSWLPRHGCTSNGARQRGSASHSKGADVLPLLGESARWSR